MATARRKTRTPMRGRTYFALALVLFMALTALAIWRRNTGSELNVRIQALEKEKNILESRRRTLEKDIRDATGRERVVAQAEKKLGLHVASDAQTRTITDTDSLR